MNSALLERYNAQVRGLEDKSIRMLHGVLDSSFNRLVRRVRILARSGAPEADRNAAVLGELRQLIPAARPDKVDAYDRIFRNLFGSASKYGLTTADYLTAYMDPHRERINVSVPIEATVEAVKEARGFLARHGQTFADTSAEIIAKGITEGRPTSLIVTETRERLSVVKSRAVAIVRTETLRAYNRASDQYYTRNKVDHVVFYATSDDRTCKICKARAGKIYKRGTIAVPLHPQCRCYLAPWDLDLDRIDPDYKGARTRHRREVGEAKGGVIDLSDTLIKGMFEAQAPVPVQ